MPIKRLTKLLISIFFLGLSGVGRAILRLLGKVGSGTCVVLYYHAVPGEHRARFARQMDILLQTVKPTRADRVEPLAPGGRFAAITFDDGFQSVIDHALPELAKREIPAALFIVTEALGHSPNWLTESGAGARTEKLMSLEQLQGLDSRLVTIGSHTLTHPVLPTLGEEGARRELSESRAKLERILGREVKVFSFPHGAFNSKLVDWCRDAGYDRVFTIVPALAFSDPREFVTGRVSVEPTDWPLEFRLKLLGAYRWLPLAFSLKRRILSIPKGFEAVKKSYPRPVAACSPKGDDIISRR